MTEQDSNSGEAVGGTYSCEFCDKEVICIGTGGHLIGWFDETGEVQEEYPVCEDCFERVTGEAMEGG